MRTAVLTVSTTLAAGQGEDRSGPVLAELATAAGAVVVHEQTVPDDRGAIELALRELSDPSRDIPLVFTTGGTGLTPDDVTPEATRAVIDREAPGFAEALRAESQRHTPLGILTRGVSGIANRTLIVNFPGSPNAVRELFGVIAPTLPHVVQTLGREHGRAGGH